MKLKKILSFIILASMVMASLSACSAPVKKKSDKLKIVTTIFPEYDWVNAVLGDKASDAEVIMLLDNGIDLHSFQPTATDIANIADCDVFIYVGGESDGWVADALSEATNKDMKVINLLDVLGDKVKEEEVVEGMEGEEEEEIEYDEHVWLSLRNAQILVREISDVLGEADPREPVRDRGLDLRLHRRGAVARVMAVKVAVGMNRHDGGSLIWFCNCHHRAFFPATLSVFCILC